MQLGFIVPAESDLKVQFQFAMQQGIEYVELQFNQLRCMNFDTQRIFDAMEGTNVKVGACGLWELNTLSDDEKTFEENKKTVFEFFDMVAAIGSPVAFINAGTYKENDTDANVAKLKEAYPQYKKYATDKGLKLAFYLGHKGNFINSRDILARVISEIPDFPLKIDPVGLMRNVKDDPYYVVSQYAKNIVHFHAKDIYQIPDIGFEIEPPVGLGQKKWNVLLGMLYDVGYTGCVIIEPHGPNYMMESYGRFKHVVLSKRHLEQFIV